MPFPISLESIAETESALGVTFPAVFKAQMSRSNGGEVEVADETWSLHPFLDKTSPKTIGRTCNDIKHETAEARKWEGFPPDGVALANNGSGDLLFLRPDGSALGKRVWMFWHETDELTVALDDVADLWRSP